LSDGEIKIMAFIKITGLIMKKQKDYYFLLVLLSIIMSSINNINAETIYTNGMVTGTIHLLGWW